MPVSHELKFIYIHVPKCAGTSISTALKNSGVRLDWEGAALPRHRDKFGVTENWLHHLTALSLKIKLSDEIWNKYFKFAFVRNPWDRAVSYFFYHKEEASRSERFRASQPSVVETLSRTATFEEWVSTSLRMRTQSEFLLDSDGKLLVDFVGRFEQLEHDFQEICSRIGAKADLPHENSSTHCSYRTYYNDQTQEIVRRNFQRDIELFSYSF